MSKLARVRDLSTAVKLSCQRSPAPLSSAQTVRSASTIGGKQPEPETKPNKDTATSREEAKIPEHKKTMAELDEELRMKMEGRSGEGGEAGLELEDGKPTAMKRGVKNNMFRLI
ncbi:MAG: hypothetical protein L6R40_004215 [Gallowayella cf. fulva]|nr:MAG: hypothetical protein L6R40_004215 [Xanthomendoza cf. fulva]